VPVKRVHGTQSNLFYWQASSSAIVWPSHRVLADAFSPSRHVQFGMASFNPSLSNPVVVVDITSRHITDVNMAAVAVTGYAKEELVGKPLDALYPPDTVAALLKDCVRPQTFDGAAALCRVGRGLLRTKAGNVAPVELYCRFVSHPTPTVLVEHRVVNVQQR
jgi:PAS domain S-box-containing protein